LNFFTSSSREYARAAYEHLVRVEFGKDLDVINGVYHRGDVTREGIKPLHIAFKNHYDESEWVEETTKRVLLFDDDPFYVEPCYRFNVVRSNRLKCYSDEIENPRLEMFGEFFVYLSKCENIKEMMEKLHKIWYEKELITYEFDQLSGNYFF
jgi:hypothetical protein